MTLEQFLKEKEGRLIQVWNRQMFWSLADEHFIVQQKRFSAGNVTHVRVHTGIYFDEAYEYLTYKKG